MNNKTTHILALILAFWLCSYHATSAQTEKEKIQQIENQKQLDKQRRLAIKLDSAITLSEQGEYLAADAKFKDVLKNVRSVPTDLTYHFGKNSFLIGKYKQSIDWLNKYIQLKGTNGSYSKEAVEWLQKAETELIKEHELEIKKASEVLSKDFDIECPPNVKIICPTCQGSTVIIKKGYLGDHYSTCPYCNKVGYLTCEEYNLLIKGKLKTGHSKSNP